MTTVRIKIRLTAFLIKENKIDKGKNAASLLVAFFCLTCSVNSYWECDMY